MLAGKYGFNKSRLLSREETLERLPTIQTNGLRGGVIYYDGQFDDTRLLIHLAATAADHVGGPPCSPVFHTRLATGTPARTATATRAATRQGMRARPRRNCHGGRARGRAYTPQNLLATLYHLFGIDPSMTFPDHPGRPQYLLDDRSKIEEL